MSIGGIRKDEENGLLLFLGRHLMLDMDNIILNRGGNIETRFEAHCLIPEGRLISDELPFPEPPVTVKLLKARLADLNRRRR
jgi:hypothetical protein